MSKTHLISSYILFWLFQKSISSFTCLIEIVLYLQPRQIQVPREELLRNQSNCLMQWTWTVSEIWKETKSLHIPPLFVLSFIFVYFLFVERFRICCRHAVSVPPAEQKKDREQAMERRKDMERRKAMQRLCTVSPNIRRLGPHYHQTRTCNLGLPASPYASICKFLWIVFSLCQPLKILSSPQICTLQSSFCLGLEHIGNCVSRSCHAVFSICLLFPCSWQSGVCYVASVTHFTWANWMNWMYSLWRIWYCSGLVYVILLSWSCLQHPKRLCSFFIRTKDSKTTMIFDIPLCFCKKHLDLYPKLQNASKFSSAFTLYIHIYTLFSSLGQAAKVHLHVTGAADTNNMMTCWNRSWRNIWKTPAQRIFNHMIIIVCNIYNITIL